MITAHVGDWLEVSAGPGTHARRGQIVALVHPDGTPPYRVHWLEDEHESLVFPPPDAHVLCRARSQDRRGQEEPR